MTGIDGDTQRRRSWWGWGWEGTSLSGEHVDAMGRMLALRFGLPDLRPSRPPELSRLTLPELRVAPPPSLATFCSADRWTRASHTYGKSYRDVVRAFAGQLDHPPDLVAFPPDEQSLVDLLDWCSEAGVAAIPYGGGTSVVGGVEPDVGMGYAGTASIDLSRLNRVLEVDTESRAALIEAGATGPQLEDALRPHGLTLRHYPQSFEFSTLGGWLATRSSGHYATGLTHIDDMVESMRVVTPAGTLETLRVPSSGAGPSPDRLFLGSEGALGVITRAWMRLQARPVHRVHAAVRFDRFTDAVAATRVLVQSGLAPSNCRFLDRHEAEVSAGTNGQHHLLLVGFESADHPVDHRMARALELCTDHGGRCPEGPRSTATRADHDAHPPEGHGGGAVSIWRNSFLRAPYLRDTLVSMGVVNETFETACTWDQFPNLHARVTESVTATLSEICGGGTITCRFTHVYPDGPAPYFTVLAPGRPGSELRQWDEIKAAASEAVLAAGGTITHHHAVGRVHRPWYDRQRPQVFADALTAVKTRLDPAGVLNPGVLLTARPLAGRGHVGDYPDAGTGLRPR